LKALIAYDGSECSDHAVTELPLLELPDNTDATILSVANIWMPEPEAVADAVDPSLSPGLAALRLKTRDLIDAARSIAVTIIVKLRQVCATWRIESLAVADSPGWAVVRLADEQKVNWVFVGSLGRGAFGRVLLGLVSHRVLTSASCSVHVSRPRPAHPVAPLRVLVAGGGSADSVVAVRQIAGRSWRAGTVFRLIAVLDPRLESVIAWPGIFPGKWAKSQEASPREWVCHLVEHFAKMLYERRLTVETMFCEGDPKHELVRHAEDWKADLLVLGAHGLHHGQKRNLGSVARAVAARTHCSLKVVRPA
jgi:nucleotide-binding universal stress UspA family protein